MYTSDEKTSIENAANLPPLELFTLAALVAENEQSTADRDTGISWCGGCGCHGLHLIATGIHDGDTVTMIAADGFHVLPNMPANAGGSAILNIVRCDAGHLIVGRTRIDGGRCFQAAEIYPVTADQIAALPELTGGK